MKTHTLLLVSLMLFSSMAFAQERNSSPVTSMSIPNSSQKEISLAEAQDWLKEKVPGLASYESKAIPGLSTLNTSYRLESISFDGCVMTLKDLRKIWFTSDKEISTWVGEWKVDLALLDSSRITIKSYLDSMTIYEVKIPTTDDRASIQRRMKSSIKGTEKLDESPQNKVYFDFKSKEMADKAASTFTRAIALCRSK